MRVILTHEQADFDALASLLAAYLLDEARLPVLPRRMNRNVRAFVTIYGAELPFVEPRDLPLEPVEMVCLVDTQAMITLKGMGEGAQVNVVDHHPRRDDLPGTWKVTVEEIGATTTLLVEALQERNGEVSMIHATLLLLGIYEDTGSLTYTRTTARDLQAAAYLLEQGANLRIAADFLNHPLSLSQQKVYDALRQNAETLKIHGHSIVIACGDAQELEEELSSIAHKLRDLLDPDALFLLINTRSGVQLIARSTTDHIDVARAAAHFGGGGHERAAAGLIRERSSNEIYQELVDLLPELVQPAVTVSQIMSRTPQLLAPDTPASEAAARMQRYGYEGYPVVENGKIVGLLTRRAVDRAISHKLNLTAASLMNAGAVSVKPDDSVEFLQRLMTDTGWGQIPVVQAEGGGIIGIVTRTDLLKTLTPYPSQVARPHLAERLERALPQVRLALLKAVAQTAHEQRLATYVVGGFVRDLLLERPSMDFDIVVEGDAIGLAKALTEKFGGRITTHARFGTAKWYLERNRFEQPGGGEAEAPKFLDLISARTEFYTHPTALPTVERGSIKLDLHRRDFTINTLALRLDGYHYGELHDYWGGLSDLRQRLVRVLHSLSFVDDPTRMLRAARFEQRFGFQIEERTRQLLQEALSLLSRVTGERIRHELDHILEEDTYVQTLARLGQLGLLSGIHPALIWDAWLEERFEALNKKEVGGSENGWFDWRRQRKALAYMLWCLRLPDEQALALAERIRLQGFLVKMIQAAQGLWRDLPALVGARPSQVVARLEDVSPTVIAAVCAAAEQEEVCVALRAYVERWRFIFPHADGAELKRRGLAQGPLFGRILEALRAAWLDGQIVSVEEEQALLDKLLAEEGYAPR